MEPPRRAGTFFAGSAGIVLLAVVFLALHLPYLPQSLEDLDSINFALGVRHFDVPLHQPHPPGYPVYILVAKIVHTVVPDEAAALGLVSVVAGAIGVLAMAALFFRLERSTDSMTFVPAGAVGMTAPLYWFTAARPLSDMLGLTAAVAIQALTIAASNTRALVVAAFCAGFATGIRSQVAWLTVPLLIWKVALHRRGRTGRGGEGLRVMAAFIAGALVWGIPLVVLTGGPRAYWHALFDQGGDDLGNIQMLLTRHGARDVVDAVYYAFVAPWAAWSAATAVLTLAALGVAWLWRHSREALAWLAVAFGPYLVFDLLFQETFTSRYALPLVIPMSYLAAAGFRWLPRQAGWLLAVPIVMFDAHVGGTSIAAFASQKAPAFRLLDDMRAAAAAQSARPVLAPDRRESLDLRKPILFVGDRMPAIDRQLPAPPQHEWLEAVKYWNSGGRAPMWFIVDPKRTSIDLVQHGEPAQYRWSLPYPVLLSGVRPNEMDWYRVTSPEWYVGEGWALTPEAAGIAQADHRDPSHAPISAWVRRDASAGFGMIGGRSFDRAERPSFIVDFDPDGHDGTNVGEKLMPGAFLRFFNKSRDSHGNVDDAGGREYERLAVSASAGSKVAVEQFDASSTRLVFGFGTGWHEQEFNPRTGERWRWLSERGELPYRAPSSAAQLTLHLEGESPRTYFSRGSTLIVRSGAQVVFTDVLSSDFSLTIPVPRSSNPIVLETDQTYVPAEHGWRRTADRRRLGLRIFKCELRVRLSGQTEQ